jgi:uncharacterized membrane protein YhfC
MTLAAIAFVIFALRRGGTWGYLGLGALVWLVTMAVKFAIAFTVSPVVVRAAGAPGNLLLYFYEGSLTGLTEVLLTWLLLHHKRLVRAPWGKVLAFGVGFGAFEALLLGLASLAAMLAGLLMPQSLNAQTMATLARSSDLLYGLVPVAERLAVIFVHIFCNVLLFYSVMRRQVRWMWVAFIYKSLLDTVAAFAQAWGVETAGRVWTIEACIIVFGVVACWGVRKVGQRYRAETQQIADAVASPVANN